MFNNNQINIFLTFLWVLTFYFNFNKSASALSSEEHVIISEIKFNDQDLNSSKLQIKASKKTNFKIYTLKNPWRLVIDIENARLDNQNYQPQLPNFIKNFQITNNEIYLRFEFALQKEINLEKSFFDSKNSMITAIIVNEKADLSMFIEQNEIINDQPTQFNNQQNNPANSSNNNLTSPNQNLEKSTTLTISNSNPIDSNPSSNSGLIVRIPTGFAPSLQSFPIFLGICILIKT